MTVDPQQTTTREQQGPIMTFLALALDVVNSITRTMVAKIDCRMSGWLRNTCLVKLSESVEVFNTLPILTQRRSRSNGIG